MATQSSTTTRRGPTAQQDGLILLGRVLFGARLARLHTIMFLKNLSMIGGALFLTQVGAGRWSLDARCAG
jgi:uncharacterized membrane protein YphA (DoxX/SURF4 family)